MDVLPIYPPSRAGVRGQLSIIDLDPSVMSAKRKQPAIVANFTPITDLDDIRTTGHSFSSQHPGSRRVKRQAVTLTTSRPQSDQPVPHPEHTSDPDCPAGAEDTAESGHDSQLGEVHIARRPKRYSKYFLSEVSFSNKRCDRALRLCYPCRPTTRS